MDSDRVYINREDSDRVELTIEDSDRSGLKQYSLIQ